MPYRVSPQGVIASRFRVIAESDGIAVAHASADTNTENAQGGWIGASGQALSELATTWRSDTESLLERLDTHADALLAAAEQYQQAEEQHARALSEVGDMARQVGGRGLG